MANLTGLHYYEEIDGNDELLVGWKNGVVRRDINGTAWSQAPGAVIDHTGEDIRFENYLDNSFLVQKDSATQSYNGTIWSTTHCVDAPRAKFIKHHQGILFLYNINFGGNSFESRVWFCNAPENNTITWGLEYGSDLAQTVDDATVTSATGLFETRKIQIGDPFLITSGTNAGQYEVASVTNETSLELTKTLNNTTTNSDYWVGGNWFDVNGGDGDEGTGIGVTGNEVYFFKSNSLWRYNITSQELRQVKYAVGTFATDSIVNDNDYLYWYHGSGVFRTNGSTLKKISSPLDDLIERSSATYEVCAWRNQLDGTVNFYIDNTFVEGLFDPYYELSYPVLSFDTDTESWTIKNYEMSLRYTARGYKTYVEHIYGANSTNSVWRLDNGDLFQDSSDVNTPILLEYETYPHYPVGSEALVDFNRVRLYIMGRSDVTLMYKLFYKATGTDTNWTIDKDWKAMTGSQSGERSEWYFPTGSRASGVAFKIIENSKYNEFTMEKISVYYSNPSNY